MIPSLVIIPKSPWPVLPVGIHEAAIEEIEIRYSTTPHRKDLFAGLKDGLSNLFGGGCRVAYLDGSFVTGKPKPEDYEVCWDGRYVQPALLDPLFLNLAFGTDLQKFKYKGEYFPASGIERRSGKTFLEFFQTDKYTNNKKGILQINNYLNGGGSK
jgi:hypothetical protein